MASLAIAQLHNDVGVDVARAWNLGTEISLVSLYILSNLWIFAPPCIQQWKGAARLAENRRPSYVNLVASDEKAEDGADRAADLPPIVKPGFDYVTLANIAHELFV